MSFSGLLDLRVQESHVVRHVKPPRRGEATRRPHALSRVRTKAFGASAPRSYPWSYPSRETLSLDPEHLFKQQLEQSRAKLHVRRFTYHHCSQILSIKILQIL